MVSTPVGASHCKDMLTFKPGSGIGQEWKSNTLMVFAKDKVPSSLPTRTGLREVGVASSTEPFSQVLKQH